MKIKKLSKKQLEYVKNSVRHDRVSGCKASIEALIEKHVRIALSQPPRITLSDYSREISRINYQGGI